MHALDRTEAGLSANIDRLHAGDGRAFARAAMTPGGYVWWYFDALTPAGDGLACIFFVGAVFSPSYAARWRRGRNPLPSEHAAVNLALYRGGKQVAWVMSEYDRVAELGDTRLAIAGSSIERDRSGWRIQIADRLAPFHQRIEGEITVEPLTHAYPPVELRTRPESGEGALHGWRVLAPRALVRAKFQRPDFTLEAIGYHDRNHGEERLDEGFARWGWARFHGPRETRVIYSITERSGRRRTLVAHALDGERCTPIEMDPLPESPTRKVGWGLELPQGFGAGDLRVKPTTLLEQAPFYARYRARLVAGDASLSGEQRTAANLPDGLNDGLNKGLNEGLGEGLGEHLDCDRFRKRWLQFLLRYKMLGAWRF